MLYQMGTDAIPCCANNDDDARHTTVKASAHIDTPLFPISRDTGLSCALSVLVCLSVPRTLKIFIPSRRRVPTGSYRASRHIRVASSTLE